MKKAILSLIVSGLIAMTAQAQYTTTTASSLVGGAYGLTVDTVDNTETITKYIKVTASHPVVSLQAVVTKISGTVAGTIRLVGSNDGVNFVDLSKASIAATALRPAYTDTLTCTNVTTNTKVWVIDNSTTVAGRTPEFAPYLYYGLSYTGSGTMSAKFSGYLVARPRKGNQ